ncbi:MAG: hypothetical protein MOB07_23745 [Acidobacteria bacterium]|nr:hypothetical protein [Acidobacteriota bacterium]
MKKQILSVVVTLSIVISLSIASLAGLISKVTADIPFDFTVKDKQFPAGKYEVFRGPATGTLIIRNVNTKSSMVSIVHESDAKAESKAKLVFHRYGNSYFLSQAWDGMNDSGSELSKSKAEREVAKSTRDRLAQNAAKLEIITVMAQAGQ